jgi:CHAT domain-containing protein
MQILSDVPFAALRKPNSPVGEGYLIQKHTISITPSLRMLHHCNVRLVELDRKGVLHAKPGTIVAVGDPVNKICLPASIKEVKFIEDLFGEKHVKKLLGPEATPARVLEWAKYPSKKGVKQMIFHIAAHSVQEGGRGKGGVVLSPPIPSQQNDGELGIYE